MTTPSLLDDLEGVVAYAWRKDGMKGWALGHNPPTQNMLDFDKYEVRELAFRTQHAELADMAKRLGAAERDAARYRWLRSGDSRLAVCDEYTSYYLEQLDAIVDAMSLFSNTNVRIANE